MGEYTMMDFFEGVELQENPNAALQLMLFILLIAILIGVGILIKEWPKIKRKMWDEEVFKYILNYKELSQNQKNMIIRLIKDNKISPKYKILIMEPIFQKYIDYEITRLSSSNIDMLEKEEAEHKILELKEKLFPSDI